MKGPAAFGVLLLVDLVLSIAIKPFPKMRPEIALNGTQGRGSAFRHTARRHQAGNLPRYMIQLYRVMRTEERIGTPDHGAALTGTKKNLYGSDSVISLVAKSCHQIGGRWSVIFDMSSLPAGNIVQLAEFRICLPAFTQSSSTLVDIYHSHSEQCLGTDCPENRLHLGRLHAHPNSVVSPLSWRVFNVTEMLRHRLQHQDLSANSVEHEAEMKEEQVQEQKGIKHPTAGRVMMVVFLKQTPDEQGVPKLIRTAKQSKYASVGKKQAASRLRRSRKKRDHQTQQQSWEGAREALTGKATQEETKYHLCRKVDMWVDFKKFGWSKWVVHPTQFNAYRCEGTCPTPVDETFTPTNHAYIQSLLNFHHPEKAPCLSCVPRRLAPLSMLYYENGKVVMRHHDDMVAEECGCH